MLHLSYLQAIVSKKMFDSRSIWCQNQYMRIDIESATTRSIRRQVSYSLGGCAISFSVVLLLPMWACSCTPADLFLPLSCDVLSCDVLLSSLASSWSCASSCLQLVKGDLWIFWSPVLCTIEWVCWVTGSIHAQVWQVSKLLSNAGWIEKNSNGCKNSNKCNTCCMLWGQRKEKTKQAECTHDFTSWKLQIDRDKDSVDLCLSDRIAALWQGLTQQTFLNH